ncbi:MAG: hypothetical protein VCA55_05730 [Verrucomicrobiales bacterium]
MRKSILLSFGALLLQPIIAHCLPEKTGEARAELFDMKEMLDASTLEVEVLSDWHAVEGEVATRQKLITIRVGELLPGREYRVAVRMIVPAERKAKGFHLTGGNVPQRMQGDTRPRGMDSELIRGGVGLVQTVVQGLEQSGQGELGRAANKRFIETLNPRYSIQYWGWPATLMRAVTAAYAEKGHFEQGKVALSGGSKNGASPSVAIIHDKRMSALHAGVSPVWDSPLRLCDRDAWDALEDDNRRYVEGLRKRNPRLNTGRLLNHFFLGGTFGPVYNAQALAAGHSWKELQELAGRMAEQVFISRHLKALKARGVDLYFHPGTHDFVAFDIAWGGRNHPQIPVYLAANSGHGHRGGHPHKERDEQNRPAWLAEHFFEGVEPLLEPPSVKSRLKAGHLSVSVSFKPGSVAESGRIWWIYDRGPDGSAGYIRDLIPDEQWRDMELDKATNTWTAEIELKPGMKSIDFFSNHRKRIRHKSASYPCYISSPYTRVLLNGRG